MSVPCKVHVVEQGDNYARATHRDYFLLECVAANGRPVGEIATVLRQDPKTGHRFFEVNGIAVQPNKRRHGIGTKLYEAAAQKACQRGYPLASRDRDGDASTGFWKKQLKKGRATVIDKHGGTWSDVGQPTRAAEFFALRCPAPRSLKGLAMPAYFTRKQERQYEHIKTSCVQRCGHKHGGRKIRRKGENCVRACKRIAASTVNAQRGMHGLGAVRGKCCVVRGKKRIACFHSRRDALALASALKKRRGIRVRCV